MVRVNCQNGDGGGSWVGKTFELIETPILQELSISKVPDGHHPTSEGYNPPRGSPREFASQRVLRGRCGSSRVLRGVRGALWLSGGPRNFSRVVTLSL